jgi:hypothetical protein
MMSASETNMNLQLLLAGCLDLWGVSGTVGALGEEQAEIRTPDGTIAVRRIAGNKFPARCTEAIDTGAARQ